MAVIILLPLEIFTGFLSKSADWFAVQVVNASGVEFESPIKGLLKAGSEPVKGLSKVAFDSPTAQGTMIVICAALLIFGALYFLVRTMRDAVGQSAEGLIERVLGRNALLAMLIGMVATMMVQSSSITTSLLVPIAAAGIITLEQAFPVALGANVGTTITALLAALAVSGANAHFGVAIALTHFLFNVVGVLIIYPVPFIRRLPLAAARNLAAFAVQHKTAAISYIGIMFYGIPALFALLHR